MRRIYLMVSVVAALVVSSCGDTSSIATTEPLPPATTTSSMPPSLGTVRVDDAGIEQLWVPAGDFTMGTDDVSGLEPPRWATQELESEQPAHDVSVTQGFWIDRFEVTNESFAAFVAGGGYDQPEHWSADGLAWLQQQDETLPLDCAESGLGHPRACITWFEAEAYASWRDGRLPTEAEWEYAARGPESLIYPWGDTWDSSLANIVDSEGTTPVGSFPTGSSWVGAEDMAGNVMEWVSDWWSSDYYQAEVGVDPRGPDVGTEKVEKGGWWGAVPYVGRGAYRHFEDPPEYEDHHIGVRIVSDS